MMKLYNNMYETVPSLLGDNIVDLIDQAYELGLDHIYVQDDFGNEFWEKITFKKDGFHLKLIKQKYNSKRSLPTFEKAPRIVDLCD